MASNVKFEIIQHLCVLSDKGNGWRKECNLVRWNDAAPKLDIREWSADRSSMSKGITLTKSEYLQLSKSIRFVKVSAWDKIIREMEQVGGNAAPNGEVLAGVAVTSSNESSDSVVTSDSSGATGVVQLTPVQENQTTHVENVGSDGQSSNEGDNCVEFAPPPSEKDMPSVDEQMASGM